MGHKLPPDQMALYRRVDEILWEEWDPIGIREHGGPRDEYRSYLPEVFRLAMIDAGEDEITEYLERCVVDAMGLSSDKAYSRQIAARVRSARAELIG